MRTESKLTAVLQQRLQSIPVGGFSPQRIEPLSAMPKSLADSHIDKISAAAQSRYGFRPSEILWDLPAKVMILAHPTFLEELSKGYDRGMAVLPKEVITIPDQTDPKAQKLYIIGDENNKAMVKRGTNSGRLLILPFEEARGKRYDPDLMPRVEIPGGIYTIGDDNGNYDREKPAHQVEVNSFLMMVYHVTQKLFREAEDNGLYEERKYWTKEGWEWLKSEIKKDSRFWEKEWEKRDPNFIRDNFPMLWVNWYQSLGWCVFNSEQEGIEVKDFLTNGFFDLAKMYDKKESRWNWRGDRLPTNAELETAMRGGLDLEFKYSWRNGIKGNTHYASSGPVEVNDSNYNPNEFGIMFPSGLANKWCHDRHAESYYQQLKAKEIAGEIIRNPIGPEEGNSRVFRGGSWFNSAGRAADYFRVASRYYSYPAYWDYFLGFAAARSSF